MGFAIQNQQVDPVLPDFLIQTKQCRKRHRNIQSPIRNMLRLADVTGILFHSFYGQPQIDLVLEKIVVAYGDEPILRYQLRVGTKRNVRIIEGFRPPALEELCLVMRKRDPRLDRVNAAIERLSAAAIPAINRKWGL